MIVFQFFFQVAFVGNTAFAQNGSEIGFGGGVTRSTSDSDNDVGGQVKYTLGSYGYTWQEAADLCEARGETLPILRSALELEEICALSPDTYVWLGITKGAQPDTLINYLDQSPAPYLENLLIVREGSPGNCMSLVCFPENTTIYGGRYGGLYGNYGYLNVWECDMKRTYQNYVCENPRFNKRIFHEETEWSLWSACSNPCVGTSIRTRSRGAHGLDGVIKFEEDSETCTDEQCAKYTLGNNGITWQEAALICGARGAMLPIVRSQSDVDAICALSPDDNEQYIWLGIIKGAQPDTLINYLDQSPAPYLENLQIRSDVISGNCMSLVCFPGNTSIYGKYGTLSVRNCDGGHWLYHNYVCENPPLAEWSLWSACSDPCEGTSIKTRSRDTYYLDGVIQAEEDSETCTDEQCVCYGLPELADRVIPTLEKTWNLVMHVRPNGVKEVYTNLFDLRRTSDYQLAEEGRLARVMLVEDSTEVSFSFWQNGIKERVIHTDPLEMNVWSTIEVRQDLKSNSKYYFSMWVNGIKFLNMENTQPAIFNNVHVFLGTDGGTFTEPAADICNSWFHTAGNSISLYGKIVGPTTECKAWGDPHITTFDGANNDVYGVTTYVLAKSKEKEQSVKKFQVRMVTSKYHQASKAEKALLDFYDDTETHVATVETNSNGNANLFTLVNDQWISQPVDKRIMKGAGYRFSFTSIRTKEYSEHEKHKDDGEYRTQLTVLTDFNVQVSQIGINIYVTIPKDMYSDKVEGLCGNNDADRTNDYQTPDGNVLPYNPQGINSRSDSEYECAKSWMVSETINSRSISNEAGPHPASVSCTDETIIAECDTLLEPSWLSICEPLVSADRRAELVRMCKIDYCMLKETKTKLDIIMHYVIECQKKSEETILCDWEVQATGQQPVCGSNEEYKGCATMCDLPHCNDYLTNKSCNSKTNTFSSCVCKKDFYLLNGVCVAADACSATGWSDWSHWSSCSNPCGGSRRRLQICQGSECTTSSQLQEEACSGDCNPCVEAHCHMDATCENNDGVAVCECNAGFDGDGTTCLPQAVAPVFNPCPSTDCWTYDTASQTCAMEPACATLSCGATAFDVTFKSALFNLEENQSSVTFAGGLPSPSWDGIQWTTNAPLGLNGMTYNIDAENNEIIFSIKLAIVGNDMKTRTDDVQDTLIELGSKSVITTPFGAAVILSCRYSMTIEIASQDYTVDGASVVDTVSATGSLAAGFAMTLNNGEHTNFSLGNVMPVEITWSVTGLSSLTFHLQSCTVQHGATVIMIVKEGCYSEKLDVLPDSNKQGFSYQVFKGVGETDSNQKISCEVNICKVGQCQIPTANNQCPAAGDDLFYSYTI